MTDKQIKEADENMLKLNDICISCISEIDECECRKVAEDLYFKLLRKEQECDMWKNLTVDNGAVALKYQQQLDQLKAEVKSKTEYIQEQRDIINQYSKEIEMYKKCQGKRASKREEELKAQLLDQEAVTLKAGGIIYELEKENRLLKVYRSITPFKVKMLVQTFTEIKQILEFYANSKMGEEQVDGTYKIMLSNGYVMAYDPKPAIQALQKISEVTNEN